MSNRRNEDSGMSIWWWVFIIWFFFLANCSVGDSTSDSVKENYKEKIVERKPPVVDKTIYPSDYRKKGVAPIKFKVVRQETLDRTGFQRKFKYNNFQLSIVEIDKHDYIVMSYGPEVGGITHKADCKFCDKQDDVFLKKYAEWARKQLEK